MALFRIAAPIQGSTPTRVPTFNGTLRAGEDLKVAFLLLDEDGETPLHVESAYAQLSLWPDAPARGFASDYGWFRPSYSGRPEHAAPGQVLDGAVGRINFQIPSSSTAGLCERYRMRIDVDLPEGVSTTAEGILQVRPGPATPVNAARQYVQIGVSPFGVGVIPASSIDGLPADADGFPSLAVVAELPIVTTEEDDDTAVLGEGVLGHMVLGH